MSLQIHLRVENNKLLLLTLLIEAGEMVSAEVLLKSFVVHKVSRSLASRPPITQMTALVSLSAMDEKLIISIEAPPTEATFWVALETALVDSARVVVAKLLMLLQLLLGKKFVLVRKDLLVPRAQVTHDFLVEGPHMSVQVWPAQACHVAVLIGAVVSKKQYSILEDLWLFVADSKVLVLLVKVRGLEIFIPLLGIVGEDDICSFGSTVCTSFRLVQRPQSEGTNVAGAVVAGRNAVVSDGRGANEADLGLYIVVVLPTIRTSTLALDPRGVSGQAITRDAHPSRLWWR